MQVRGVRNGLAAGRVTHCSTYMVLLIWYPSPVQLGAGRNVFVTWRPTKSKIARHS